MTDAAAIREEALLQEAVTRLVEVFRPEQIYLFGSRARGDWHTDSDYDLIVIGPRPTYRHTSGRSSPTAN